MTASPELLEYGMSENVVAFSTTRQGGYGTGKYGAFNINPFCGDSLAAIARNRAALACRLGLPEDNIVFPHQVHGAEGIFVDEKLMLSASKESEECLEGYDYIATTVPRLCVGVSTADCVPMLLYCEASGTVAAIHAGWRGTLQRVAQKAVGELARSTGLHPGSTRAVIGPSISCTAFEVGDEVYEAFAANSFDMEQIAVRRDKWHIDLWRANALQLVQAGLQPGNIEISGICTYANSERFFSARHLGTASGRIFTGIYIK